MFISTSHPNSLTFAKTHIDCQMANNLPINLTLEVDMEDFLIQSHLTNVNICQYLSQQKSYSCSYNSNFEFGYNGLVLNTFIKCEKLISE